MSIKIFNSLSTVIRFELTFGPCGPFKISIMSKEKLDLIVLYFTFQPALSVLILAPEMYLYHDSIYPLQLLYCFD